MGLPPQRLEAEFLLMFSFSRVDTRTEIRRLFTAEEIRAYLDRLERTKFLAPEEPDLEVDDLDDKAEEQPWPDSPVLGAEELFRFSRLRQLVRD